MPGRTPQSLTKLQTANFNRLRMDVAIDVRRIYNDIEAIDENIALLKQNRRRKYNEIEAIDVEIALLKQNRQTLFDQHGLEKQKYINTISSTGRYASNAATRAVNSGSSSGGKKRTKTSKKK